MSSDLSLERFPPEVLVLITQHLPALNVFQLVYLSGDTILRRKAFQGGVTSMSFKSYALGKIGLEFLDDFKGLHSVSINAFQYQGTLDLFDLPPTITHLSLQGSCSHWLAEKSARGIFQEVRTPHLNFRGGGIFPFKNYLPKLTHLNLTCHYLPGYRCEGTTTQLVRYYLPPSLTVLRLSHLDQVANSAFSALPNLTSLSQPPYHTQNIVPFDHSSIALPTGMNCFLDNCYLAATPPTYPLCPKNARTVYLRVHGFYGSNSTLLSSIASKFPMDRTSPSTDVSASLPPLLTALNVSDGSFTPGREMPLVWPASLTEIHISNGLAPCHDYSLFPKTLLDLTVAGFLTMESVETLPPKLTKLTLSIKGDFVPNAIAALPSSLTHLDTSQQCIAGHTALMPRGLKTLRIWFQRITDSIFWGGLPPGLTELYCLGSGNDQHLNYMPKSLTSVHFPQFMIHGHHYVNSPEYSTATSIEIPSHIQMSRHIDGSVMLSGKTTVWNEPLFRDPIYARLQLTKLPISLTDLTIGAFHDGKPHPLNLPNLTRLKISDFSAFNWMSTLPSLTQLALTRASVYIPPDIVNMRTPPPGLTRLTIESVMSIKIGIPQCLKPQLLIIEDLSKKAQIDWKELPNLTSLTLAKFAKKGSVFPTAVSISRDLPALRHLSFTTADWAVNEATLKEIAAAQQLTSFSCRRISIPSIEPYGTIPPDCMVDGSIDLTTLSARLLMDRFPFFKLLEGATIHIGEVTQLSTRMMLDVVGPRTLTSLTIGRHARLWPKFAKMLPNTLISLDILEASGIHSGTPRALPSSLRSLRIDASELTRDAFRELPRGLTELEMDNGRFFAKHAAALPAGLLQLSINAQRLGDNALENLPPSITALELLNVPKPSLFYRGMPPALRELSCSSMMFFYNMLHIDTTLLPTTLTKLIVHPDPAYDDNHLTL